MLFVEGETFYVIIYIYLLYYITLYYYIILLLFIFIIIKFCVLLTMQYDQMCNVYID